MSRFRATLIALITPVATMAIVASAYAYDPITWSSLDCGGAAFVTGGGYRLGGTIGQPDAGRLSGGAFTLGSGFWIGGQPGQVGVDGDSPEVLSFRFFPTRPNPVRSQSLVAFDLPRPTRVALSLFDVSGRAMRRWEYGLLPAGHQERAWRAEDESGRALASGVYFLRLETDRERGVHKVLVLR
jgi:hypothetical protein